MHSKVVNVDHERSLTQGRGQGAADAVLEGKNSAALDVVQAVNADGDEFVEVREGA